MSSRIIERFTSGLIVAALVVFALTGSAVGDSIKVTIEGAKQGSFKADSSGKISASAFAFAAESPRDAASGQASGMVQHRPLTITKAVDAASPQLFQALMTNESLKSVVVEVYSGTGGKEALVQTIRLSNASVGNLRQHVEPTEGNASNDLQEEVSFSYQTMEMSDQAPRATPELRRAPAPVKREPAIIPPTGRPAPTRVPLPRR
jgi:type VI secretion system secreted protein Hcp